MRAAAVTQTQDEGGVRVTRVLDEVQGLLGGINEASTSAVAALDPTKAATGGGI